MVWEDEKEFNEFRQQNQHLRFWEALRTFSGLDQIIVKKGEKTADTVYWQDVKADKMSTGQGY